MTLDGSPGHTTEDAVDLRPKETTSNLGTTGVVGDGMTGRFNTISKETCRSRSQRPERKWQEEGVATPQQAWLRSGDGIERETNIPHQLGKSAIRQESERP